MKVKPKRWKLKEWIDQYRSPENFSSLNDHLVANMLLTSLFMQMDDYIKYILAENRKMKNIEAENKKLITLLEKACLYLKEGRAKFAPHTTNSFVDELILDIEKLKDKQ